MINLKGNPFYLNDEGISWVTETLEQMSKEDKIAQLFCLIGYRNDTEFLTHLASGLKVGGLMCRAMKKEEIIDTTTTLQSKSKIPMLIAANLEAGGNGITSDGTKMGCHMQVAATNDVEMAYKLGQVCGKEGGALGANFAFAPVIDIDYNFRNPITNTRTFGSNVETVKNMGVAYVKGVQECGVAASIKHFPGDGIDDRDQHLVTSINGLTCDEWDKTYGEVYKACIGAGALTVMIGHIAQPAYSKMLCPNIKDSDILPASLSYELTTTLLKERLGFNGLVITDATSMAGMNIPMSREKAVPQAIAAGCDMFLFTRNLEEDFVFMRNGVENGTITAKRLDEAVTKILALKAALKLHIKSKDGSILATLEQAGKVVGCNEHKKWAMECADKGITLVKEEKNVLPISPDKYKRVLLYGIEGEEAAIDYGVKTGRTEAFKKMLEEHGYTVELFKPRQGFEGLMESSKSYVEKYDLIIYIANLATKSNQTMVRIEWASPMGANVPIYINQIPTIFVSLENPYHLQDVPRVKTFINTYGSTEIILKSLLEKLEGNSEFKGISPVDAFCGKWDARL